MMAYDMQLKDFTTMYDEEASLRGNEELVPHSYIETMNPYPVSFSNIT